MEKVRISAVSYLNTKPFLHGLFNSELEEQCNVALDIPSECARKLLDNEVDVGLVPVAVLPYLHNYEILTKFCIGCEGPVRSVKLYSQQPIEEVERILLDYQSRTSVMLLKVLAKELWKISPHWLEASEGYENMIEGTTAALVIGDRTFGMNGNYAHEYDLGNEWYQLTQTPFVFACWAANKPLPQEFKDAFNEAMQLGINNIELVAERIQQSDQLYANEAADYLQNSISYELDEAKKEGLELFLKYVDEMSMAHQMN